MSCPIVTTRNGKVSGRVAKASCDDAKPVYAYRNIPYGKPPVGSLRFMPPQPAEPWKGVRDGTKSGKAPVQSLAFQNAIAKYFPISKPDGIGELEVSEDCLNLVVYTPEPKKGEKLPVMVWIFGGGFQMGSEMDYDGTVLCGLNNVILVVPNYRLNIFGFLSLGRSSQCTGNAGLLDQQLALKWVQNNIDAFGGDKDNVTIFGESAGGTAVHLQTFSPSSRGLFHKAISHSGQATLKGLFSSEEKNAKLVKRVMEELKIEEKDEAKLLKILQKRPHEDFPETLQKIMMENTFFTPMADGKVLKKTPDQYMKDKDFQKIPYIIGCNNSEGHGLLVMFTSPDFEKGISEELAMKNATDQLQLSETESIAAKKLYLNNEYGDRKYSRMFGDMMGDVTFVQPAVSAAKAHTEAGADVYQYVSEFQVRMNHDDAYGEEVGKKPEWCMCDHGDDLHVTFGHPFTPFKMEYGARYSDEEKAMSRKWMTYVTNFARTGDPNKGARVDLEWPKHTSQGDYLKVNHQFKIGKNFRDKEVEFWSKTIPGLRKGVQRTEF